MCSSCEGKLITAYDFKQLSEKSDSLLRELIKSLPEENIIKEETSLTQPDFTDDFINDEFDNEADAAMEIDDRDFSDSDYEDLETKKSKKSKHKYVCSQCDKVFRTKKGLKIHERKHTTDNDKVIFLIFIQFHLIIH